MPLPAGKPDQIVGPHQPAEPVARTPLAKRPQGLVGQRRAEFHLGRDHPKPRPAGNQMTGPGKACAERCHLGAVLQRVLGAYKPPDFIKTKLPRGAVRQVKVALMRRIERAPKQPDPQPAAVMEKPWRKMPPQAVGFTHREAGHCL